MTKFDFEQANDEQKKAILATEGPLLIIAGPGTGKTFTLVKRIAYLVVEKKVKLSEIMVVTFTEKAGKELLTRISNEFAKYDLNLNINEMYIGTFHSICLRLMKEYPEFTENDNRYRMLDEFEQAYFVCRNIESFNRFAEYSKYIHSKSSYWQQSLEICHYVNQMMEELVDIDAMEKDNEAGMRFLGKLVKRYMELLERNTIMDFSSILTKTHEMLIKYPGVLVKIQDCIRYIMVDEYQDTNYIQEQLVFLLAGDKKNICVVGDDDQSMYRFRGATIRNILEFPGKFDSDICKVIHLNMNYRSEPGIIDFYNHWMEDVNNSDLFHWNQFRYSKNICVGKQPILPQHSVYACNRDSIESEGAGLLDAAKNLLKNGNIHNYNQIAVLFRSVKSEEAKQIGELFEASGIPVYSPRSDLFFERIEVKQILGCLIRCFETYCVDLKNNDFHYVITEKLRNYYIECLRAAMELIRIDSQLQKYIEDIVFFTKDPKSESEIGFLDIFYRIVAFAPFNKYLQADPAKNVIESRAARNLSEISRMLSKYAFLHDKHKISKDNKVDFSEEFFNIYLKYLYEDGIGEYEDECEYAPSGCISFITIHQSKGLEFPVVIVGSLGNAPKQNNDQLLHLAETRFFHRKPYEPMEDIKLFDFWRIYYTAFSRAQNLLILASKKKESKYFGEYLSRLPDIKTFNDKAIFADVKAVNYKKVYSFTSHISIYDGCPKQYKFYKEYGFSQHKMFHTAVGTLVHATLEDMNKCIIDGRLGRVNEAVIAEWFLLNYRNMQQQTGYSLTEEQREEALSQVIRYYQHRKSELGKVWKAEEEINLVLPDYILQGVIDLVEGQGDTVEIVDYKTGPKPDINGHPERIEHYRKQLEIYAYLIEKRYGKRVSRMHLYYTNCQEESPLISFQWIREAIDNTVKEISDTIIRIERKEFEKSASNSYACKYCDLKFLCGKDAIGGG